MTHGSVRESVPMALSYGGMATMLARLDDDRTVAYEDEGRGPPIVLLHAFPLASAMWRPVATVLGTRARVLTPCLAGFGASSAFVGPPSIEAMAADVARWLDALGIAERIVLGGLSMGGYVALAFAHHHGERLRALVLADTRAEADGPEARWGREHMLGVVAREGTSGVLEQMLPRLVGEATRKHAPEVVEEVRQIVLKQSPRAIADAICALRDRPDRTTELRRIAVPTLAVFGSDDAITPPAVGEALGQAIAGARLAIIEGAGHLSAMERPRGFADAVTTFLRSAVEPWRDDVQTQ